MDAVTVGLDIGTTSIKAVAVDASGKVLGRARMPHRVVVPTPDRLEHDAAQAWQRNPRRALRGVAAHDPQAVAVTAMVPSLTAVDRRGHPLTAGLLYGDERGRPDGAAAVPVPAPAPGTGGAEMAGFLRWASRSARGAAGFWPAQAVANRSLGGTPAIDMAVAYTADPLYGPGGWDAGLCRDCGVSVEQLPAVDLPGAPVGRVDGEGPLLTAGSVDVWCEQLVAGASLLGDVHVICGTTLIVWAVVDAAGPAPHPGLWSVPHSEPGRRMVGGASNAGGLFLDWAARMLRAVRPAPLDPAAVPVWSPYPRGERVPHHDPFRRAALHDLDLTHGPAAVQRAAWEASAFVVRRMIDLGRVPARRIVATGGGTRVPGWMAALADGTGLPVHVAAEPEGAAVGAAFLARLAAGLDTDLREAGRWARTGSVVDPDPRWVARCGQRYHRFVDLSGEPTREGSI